MVLNRRSFNLQIVWSLTLLGALNIALFSHSDLFCKEPIPQKSGPLYDVSKEIQTEDASIGAYIPIVKGADAALENPFLQQVAKSIANSEYHQIFYDQFLGADIGRVVNDVSTDLAAGIITASSVNVSGLTTTKDLLVTGVVTATSFVGSGQIGVGSGGSFIGAGATMIDFKTSGGSNTVDLSAGIATVTVTSSGVSLGLAIALGG